MKNMLSTIKAILSISVFIFCLFSFTSVSAGSIDLENGILVEYKFEDNGLDSSGNGQNATIYSSSYGTGALPSTGKALITGGYAKMPLYSLPYEGLSRSISFYAKIKSNSTSVERGIIKYGIGFDEFNFYVYSDNRYAIQLEGDNYIISKYAEYDKWQNYVLNYSNNRLDIYIDGALIYTKNIGLTTRRHSTYPPKLGYGMDIDFDEFKAYNRILNIDEVTYLANRSTIIGNVTTLEVGVNPNNMNNIDFTINNINEVNPNTVNFSYAFSGTTYTNLSGSLNGPITNGNFNFNLDLSSKPDGDIIIYVKANDGYVDSNISQITITKDTSTPSIQIQSIIIDQSTQARKITMITDFGTGSYSINTTGICNNTLTFLPYQEVTFSSNLDNGKYVCYKVDVGYGNIHYKLSSTIAGIGEPMSYVGGNIFYNYTNWAYSTQAKINDGTLAFLKMLVTTSIGRTTGSSTSYPSSLVDINGDGLIDMLYTSYGYSVTTGTASNTYAIMINNGDYTFTPVYRCVYLSTPSSSNPTKYYGNCSDTINF